MKDIKRGLWLIAIGMWMLVGVTYIHAAENAKKESGLQPGDVKGGYFIYSWTQGKFAWEPFLKVRHPQDGAMNDNGEPFIWGYRPWNLEPPDKDGKTLAVDILESQWIPCDDQAHKVTIQHPNDPDRKVERMIKCPDMLWHASTQMAGADTK